MKKLFSHDPLTGTTKFFHYDESVDEQNFAIQTVQETTPIIDANRAEMNDAPTRIGSNEDFVKVASIPLTIYMDLQKKGITKDPKAFKRWLNDPDNRFFRTRPGVV